MWHGWLTLFRRHSRRNIVGGLAPKCRWPSSNSQIFHAQVCTSTTNHYRGCMNYMSDFSESCWLHRSSKPFVVLLLYTGVDSSARDSVASYPLMCSPDCTELRTVGSSPEQARGTPTTYVVGHLSSAYDLVRPCSSVAVSPRLKFTCKVMNEYSFIDRQNPCINSRCPLP